MENPKTINPSVIAQALHGYERASSTGSDHRDSMEEALRQAMGMAHVSGWWDGGYKNPDTCIAIPEFQGKPGGRPRYPFWKMEIGQSHYEMHSRAAKATAAAHAYGKRHGWSFTSKREGEGVRIWRTA